MIKMDHHLVYRSRKEMHLYVCFNSLLVTIFFTVTRAGVSQPKHVLSQVAYEAFQPLQDGFK
jgi:hypothetical protein